MNGQASQRCLTIQIQIPKQTQYYDKIWISRNFWWSERRHSKLRTVWLVTSRDVTSQTVLSYLAIQDFPKLLKSLSNAIKIDRQKKQFSWHLLIKLVASCHHKVRRVQEQPMMRFFENLKGGVCINRCFQNPGIANKGGGSDRCQDFVGFDLV